MVCCRQYCYQYQKRSRDGRRTEQTPPTEIDLTANDSNEANTSWKNTSTATTGDGFFKTDPRLTSIAGKTSITMTKNGVAKVTPNLKIIEDKETVQIPTDASIVMTDKWGTTASPPVKNNPAGNDNDNGAPTLIAMTSKGYALALFRLTSTLACNRFQTAGQLLKAVV
jgi:hypothetical protein